MSMKRCVLAGVILIGGCFIAQAHEFWLEPLKFFFAVGEKAVINFKVGENFVGEPWDLKKHRIEKLEIHHDTKSIDLRESVNEGEKNNLQVALNELGTHLIVMQSNNAFIELEAEKFNKYLKEDGLDDIYSLREKSNAL